MTSENTVSEDTITDDQVQVKRLDHLGIVAGVIKDLKIVEMIDDRLGTYEDETLSAGETVAGMIINGLGFSNKPLYLTPLFFKNRPLEYLFRDGVEAEDFNRFKLGRVLDRSNSYGNELLFGEISLNVCRQEQVDTRFNSNDTTSFTLSGNYLTNTQTGGDKAEEDTEKEDNETVKIKLGHSKAHRPDLKQVMLEMMVTQDGGIPLIGKSLDGNASDNTVFKERSEKLIEQFKDADTIRYLIGDSKLYTEKNAVNLKELKFITRIPNRLNIVGETIDQALVAPDNWETLDDDRVMQTFIVDHYGMEQRWHVLSSDTSRERASKQVDKQVKKEAKIIKKQLFHLQAKRHHHPDNATKMAQTLAKGWKFHTLNDYDMIEHKKYEGKGRPKKDQKPIAITYQIVANSQENKDTINQQKEKKGHYIIGGNTDPQELSHHEVIDAYKKQYHVERGFRFLKDPLFFTSSLFVKRPDRMMGLLMVMLLSLLVYGIAERRMRANLKTQNETLPDQLRQTTQMPTLRWVFQLLEGINHIKITLQNKVYQLFEGITELRQKIVGLFGKSVENLYRFSSV